MINNNIQKDWSELLREKAGSVAGDKPSASFEEIRKKMLAAAAAGNMAEATGASAGTGRRRGWFKYAAAVAVFAFAGALLLTNRNGGPESTVIEMLAEVTPVAETGDDVQEPATLTVSTPNPTSPKPATTKPATPETAPSEDVATESVITTVETDLLAESKDDDITSQTEAKAGSANGRAGTNTAKTNYTNTHNNQIPASADPFAEPVEPLRKQLDKFSVSASGLLAGNISDRVNNHNADRSMPTYTDSKGNVYYSMGAPEISYHYSAPVSGGISLRYNITDRFFAETGLRLTYLHTWINPSGADQNLLYAGIPFGVGCNIVNLNDFQMYGSVYGMGAKCVMGRESAKFPSNYTKLDEIPLMWSAGASLGASYNFTRHFGIFAEPTVSYFIPDDKAPQTLYKENPFYFTVNVGIRFNFQ